MSQRSVLILAAVMTAFSLVVLGAAVGGVFGQPPGPAQVEPPAADLASTPAVPGELVAQREEAWRKLLDEANARLAAQATAKPTPPAGVLPAAAPQVPQAAALIIAQARAPAARLLTTPELVSFQGTTAWEVVLDQGTVYVDATSARVLHDGTAGARPGVRPDHGRGDDDERHHRSAYARRERHGDDDDEDEDDDD